MEEDGEEVEERKMRLTGKEQRLGGGGGESEEETEEWN